MASQAAICQYVPTKQEPDLEIKVEYSDDQEDGRLDVEICQVWIKEEPGIEWLPEDIEPSPSKGITLAKVNKRPSGFAKRLIEREKKRKYRENLKANPEKLEKMREYDRSRKRKAKGEGTIKTVTGLTQREKYILQNIDWKEDTSKEKKNIEITESADQVVDINSSQNLPRGHTPGDENIGIGWSKEIKT
ncbi:uncharacterized protein [Halyomorpha halys]|uniref:uncharacterized protein isoform X4 n=1 Tax=Halyomorpha halys TaxID=286706 RepID=UPI0034D1F38C